MRRRALIVSAPLAGAMAGPLGLAGCSREIDRPSWIISAEIGTPHPHVLWVVVAQASLRESLVPDFTGFSGPQRRSTDLRLQTWQVDLPEGRLRPLRVLPLDEVDDGAPSVFVGEWSAAGLTMTVGWRDRHNVAQHRWWHYPAGRVAAAGKAGHWRPMGQPPALPGPADSAVWARLTANHERDAVDLIIDRGRQRVRVLQLNAQGQPVWLPPARPLPLG